ncbi:Hint domain-containing protein, partial [Acetobacter tropicalis]|uniref:Hint domain-containing protein n=1 Tax=Acetobacter tropicalis TaxID=104102 RepID=UPI001EE63E59
MPNAVSTNVSGGGTYYFGAFGTSSDDNVIGTLEQTNYITIGDGGGEIRWLNTGNTGSGNYTYNISATTKSQQDSLGIGYFDFPGIGTPSVSYEGGVTTISGYSSEYSFGITLVLNWNYFNLVDGTSTDLISLGYTTAPIGMDGQELWDIPQHETTPACFLSGSMIRTPKGDVVVENIKIGDEVVTFDWKSNKEATQPVVWVGKAHVNVRHGLPDDEAGWPVRVLKDAIADGVPYKDMLITAEHCLFFKD